MGRAEDIFQRVSQGGAAEIERMIGEPVVESLFLDYKRVATNDFKRLHADDRKNLAKAISGFANSEGGVVIWGVDCRRTLDEGDIPTGPMPITNPKTFRSLLSDAVSGVTIPAHGNVDNVHCLRDDGTGYVISHIPVGLNVPYRTLIKNEQEEYYMRAGSGFVLIPHAILAGLFGRAPHPKLEIIIRFSSIRRIGNDFALILDVSVGNVGRGLAEDLFFISEGSAHPDYTVTHNPTDLENWQWWEFNRNGGSCITAMSKSSQRLPPGSELQIANLWIQAPFPVPDGLTLNMTCGARNAPGSARTLALPKGDLDGIFGVWRDVPDNPESRKNILETIERVVGWRINPNQERG